MTVSTKAERGMFHSYITPQFTVTVITDERKFEIQVTAIGQ